MKTAMILFTAALAFASANDRLAEERYKAKYGRYSPAEEARRKAAKETVSVACCRHTTATPAPVATAADTRHKAKYGTTFGKAPAAEPAETIMTCGDTPEPEVYNSRVHACCKRDAAKPAPVVTAADARHKAKYGTTFGRAPVAEPAETMMTCGDEAAGHACCVGRESCKRG